MRVTVILVLLLTLFSLGAAAEDFHIGKACVSSSTDIYVPDEIIVKFKDGVNKQQATTALADLGTSLISTNAQIGVQQIRIPAGKTVEEMVAAFSSRSDVEYAEPNYIAHAFFTPNDPYYVYQWHMPLINMPTAWDQSTGIPGVVVAVIDCGVAYETYGVYTQAPDLAGTSFVPGYDFVNNDAHPNDDCAHGTHVAGTVAQTTNNSLGVTGVAFNCSIMPIKVLNASGSGTYTAIVNGIIFAADNGAEVINMSLGGAAGSTALQDAVIYAYNKGVTIVCAAGNAGTSAPQYPAAYAQCISVSAVRYDKTYTWYTSYGTTIDICAPGGDLNVDQNADGYVDGVLQQTHDGTNYGTFAYYFYEGTSMASPHVAGVAALLISKNGGTMTPDAVRAALQNTAEDRGTVGWDQYYGYGLVNANAALLTIGNNPPVAAFSGTPTSGNAPLTVTFTDASTNTPTSWAWTFGDGGTSTLKNPSYTYTTAGTYSVTLTATNAYGSNSLTKTGYISVTTNAPVAAFSGTPTSGTAPLTVAFTDASTYNPTSWAWTFGDGGTSTLQNPSHIYATAGTYSVTLTATNAYGSNSLTKTGYITVTAAPVWTIITYDNFETGMGSYTDGGIDMLRYTGTTNAHQGAAAANIQDNSGIASSFYHTAGYNVTGYTTLEVAFWFKAVSMEAGEDFWVQFYNGTAWQTVASYASGTGFLNGIFYNKIVTISSSQYNFSTSAKLRFMCDAGNDIDDVYIDEIEFRGTSSAGAAGMANAEAGSEVLNASSSLPDAFELSQNYPNPFNPSTVITYSLTASADVKLVVINVLGQQIRTLVNEYQSAGGHSVVWDGRDQGDNQVASGIYFYRMSSAGMVDTKKMLLMK
jgi:serine protease